METTFITIHDLTEDAHILYASDSIVDILGFTPDEVVNKSCWDFFHPTELPMAKQRHERGVNLDKAAVLAYCNLRNRQEEWVGCECCFTVVYDVIVVCTSIYRRDITAKKRADQAPVVRRLFSSSPKDPRYHMLSHLSAKFSRDIDEQIHEPRAALFLNRFTRTLTVMYATSGIEQVIGIPGEDMKGRSFYFCIAETCLEDAVKCVETAKGNDSIAYLRFRFRDPRQGDTSNQTTSDEDTDASMTDVPTSDEEDGGAPLGGPSPIGPSHSVSSMEVDSSNETSRNNSGNSVPQIGSAAGASTVSSAPTSPSITGDGPPTELEAVVSCTSDGLVVILRRARPIMPGAGQDEAGNQAQGYPHGFFAAPWAPQPIYVPTQPLPYPEWFAGMNSRGGPIPDTMMNSIRDAAVFAWALTGINGGLADYTRGTPSGQSQPTGGFPVWDPVARETDSGNASASQASHHSPGSVDPFGDPRLSNTTSGSAR